MSDGKYMDKELGREFLLLLSDALNSVGAKYFLIQGTALGAHRDNGFTPTELDIDLGFLSEDFRAGTICQVLLNRNVEVNTHHRHWPYERCHTVVARWYGIKADLVSYTLDRSMSKRFACSPDDPPNVGPPYCIVHERSMLETYTIVTMFGRKFRVPSPTEQYLELEYGPEWRTPREDHVSRTRVYDYLMNEYLKKEG